MDPSFENELVENFPRSAPPSRASSLSSAQSEAKYVSKIEENENRSLQWSVMLNVIFVICFAILAWVLIAKFDEANFHRSESNALKEELTKEKEKIEILLKMESSYEREKDQKLKENRLLISKLTEKDLQLEQLEKIKKEFEEKMYEYEKLLNDEISWKDRSEEIGWKLSELQNACEMMREESRRNEIEKSELQRQISELKHELWHSEKGITELATKKNAPFRSDMIQRISSDQSFSSNAPTEPDLHAAELDAESLGYLHIPYQ